MIQWNRKRYDMIEKSLEYRLPTIWQMEEHSQEKAQSDRVKVRSEKIRKGDSQKRKDADARKSKKVAKHSIFAMFCGSGDSKSRLLKWLVRSQLARWKMKNCTPLWCEGHYPSQNAKKIDVRTTFWKLRCRKNARRRGARHMSKSKCKS